MKEYKKKYYVIYRIINIINNKEYIGFHSTNDLNDNYMGSGKILKKAIKKYGINNFKKEIIKIFDNQKDAELLESELVNINYINREDTYNVSIGGNVCILYGENNGFYGKKHSKETVNKIIRKNKIYYETHDAYWKNKKIPINKLIINGVIYPNISTAISELKSTIVRIKELLYQENNGFLDPEKNKKFKQDYKLYLDGADERKALHLEHIREATRKEERRQKISNALKGRHNYWNEQTNKDPEKIRKTAETHRGMKRSEETKQNISESKRKFFENGGIPHNKGKRKYYNKNTFEIKWLKPEEITDEWILGAPK